MKRSSSERSGSRAAPATNYDGALAPAQERMRQAQSEADEDETAKERRDPHRREAGQGQLRQPTTMGHLRLHKRKNEESPERSRRRRTAKERRDPHWREAGQGQLRQPMTMGHLTVPMYAEQRDVYRKSPKNKHTKNSRQRIGWRGAEHSLLFGVFLYLSDATCRLWPSWLCASCSPALPLTMLSSPCTTRASFAS
jgi:hypothetical protein